MGLHQFNASFIGTGPYTPLTTTLSAFESGGLKLHANTGAIRFYTGGSSNVNERMVINSSGNVGIGTASPSAKLHIDSSVASTWVTSGATAGNYASILFGQGTSPASGDYAEFIRYSNASAAGFFPGDFIVSNLTKKIILSTNYSGGYRADLVVASSGNVGIGTTTPAYPLHVVAAGSDVARFNGTGSTQCTVVAGTGWSCSSDMNLKKDIEVLSSSSTLDQLLELNPVSYRWKDGNNDQILQHGFIAQDVEGIFPELVTTDSASGLKSLSMGGMIPYIVSAIQEMAHKIANISKWFGNNGNKFKVEGEVCVDDVCVTKEQFKALLQNGNTGGGSSGGGGSSTPEPEPVVTEPEPTPTPEEGAGSGGGGSEVPPVDEPVLDPEPTPEPEPEEPTPEPEEESAPEPASVVE